MKKRFLSLWLMLATAVIARPEQAGDMRSWQSAILAADSMMKLGHFEDALEILIQTLPWVRRADPDDPRAIVTMNNIGTACQSLGSFEEAEDWYCRALRLLEKNKRSTPDNKLRQLNNLTTLYLAMGETAKARKQHNRILKLLTGSMGPCHPDIAHHYENAAAIARARRRPAEAETWCLKALAAWKCLVGPSHSSAAAVLNNLGVTFLDRKDYVRAADYFAQSVRMWEETSGSTHPGLAEPLLNLGRSYLLRHEPGLAEPLLARALSTAEAAYGGSHSLVAQILDKQAAALKERGRNPEAVELERRAAVIVKNLAQQHTRVHSVNVSQLQVERSKQPGGGSP